MGVQKILLFLSCFFVATAQHTSQRKLDITPPDYIKSIVLYNTTQRSSSPVAILGDRLLFCFDDLDSTNTPKNYSYKITHCTDNWVPSDAFFMDYAKGFEKPYFDTPLNSFNTDVSYKHYRLDLPNRNLQLIKGGNYLLTVFENNKPIFTKRFTLVRPQANISIEVTRSLSAQDTINQQALVKVTWPSMPSIGGSTTLMLMKNNRWQSIKSKKEPDFNSVNGFIYQFYQENAFAGGSLYRWFDTKSLLSSTFTIDRIERKNTYHAHLRIDAPRAHLPYTDGGDLRGGFVFRNIDHSADKYSEENQAQYVWVHFYLDYPKQEKEKIYLYGGFNQYVTHPDYMLNYNEKSELYEAKVLLKQGFYNYKYVVLEEDGHLNTNKIDGSFYQTPNRYQAIWYYTPWGTSLQEAAATGIFEKESAL